MKKAFKTVVAFPKTVLTLSIIICLFFGYFTTKLEIDASTQTLLLENDRELFVYREVSKRYETPNFLVAAYTPNNDLLSDKTLEKIKIISDELEKINGVISVFSILNAPLLQNSNVPLSDLIKHIPNLMDKDINKTAAKNEFLTSALYKNSLVSSDFSTTAIVINLKTNEKYNEYIQKKDFLNLKDKNGTINKYEKQELLNLNKEFKIYRDELREKEHENIENIKSVLRKYSGDEKLFLGGINMIADDMVGYVKNDLITYGISVLLLLIFCLWLFFRQIRFIIIPVLVCFLSVVSASGIFGFFGYEITVISSNYVALQLIITISVVIHLIVAYRELYLLHPKYTQIQLIYLTLQSRANPCFFAIFTTVIGFFFSLFERYQAYYYAWRDDEFWHKCIIDNIVCSFWKSSRSFG